MGENVLVTGGAGFIGSHLVDRLLAEGYRVRVLDNLEPQVHGDLGKKEQWPIYCNPKAEYHFGDVRDTDILHRALHDIDVVFHLAAMVGVGQSMYDVRHYVDVNTNGTANLLDIIVNNAKIRGRVRKLLVASSMSSYGEGEYSCPIHGRVYPQSRSIGQLRERQWETLCSERGDVKGDQVCGQTLQPIPTRESKPLHSSSIYAITKKTQEEMCLTIGNAYNIPTVALRLFNAYGTRQSLSNPYTGVVAIFSSRLLNGNPPVIFEDGCQMRDFIHVSDLTRALTRIMENETATGVYNVGSGQPITILEITQALIEHLGVSIEPVISRQYRAGDIRHCYADIEKLRALGYEPQISFAEGVVELIDWVREQTAIDSFDQAHASLIERGLTI